MADNEVKPIENAASVVSAAPAEAIVKGYRTTEFWLTVVATLWGMILSSGLILNVSQPWVQLVGALIAAICPASYVVSRGMVKK